MGRVLVVDDSLTYRQYTCSIVRDSDFTPVEASDGAAALQLLDEGTFDLALVDVNMPGVDGYSFVESLRQHADHAAIPAIMVSTASQLTDQRKGYRAGANGYLVKPVQPELLLSILGAYLGDGQ